MKARRLIAGSTVLLVALYLTVIVPARERAEKRRRGELHLLNTIQGGISGYLETGGQLPTNSSGLSNAVNWELSTGISEFNRLPQPSELYTVLRNPVELNDYYHSVFLVRAKPCRWPGYDSGRWVVGVGTGWTRDPSGKPIPMAASNHVYRTWVPEGYLPATIRSQLKNNATP